MSDATVSRRKPCSMYRNDVSASPTWIPGVTPWRSQALRMCSTASACASFCALVRDVESQPKPIPNARSPGPM